MTSTSAQESSPEYLYGLPASERVAALYQRAFAQFGAQALWSSRAALQPALAERAVRGSKAT